YGQEARRARAADRINPFVQPIDRVNKFFTIGSYGIGFPPFRGGALRYIDSLGVAEFVALADQYADLGALYHPTAKLREMAKTGQRFFG
ncbi:hypothetical protein ACQKP7_27560, partial [Pseudomonas frederiksbergensis]|uniref:hypothetical protein n=1 Tax=Pseudomonas frederiksbergensis TaxID=104087 RepID=UPI003D01EE08